MCTSSQRPISICRQCTTRHTGHRAAGGPLPLLQLHWTARPQQPPLRRSTAMRAARAGSRMQEPPARRHRGCRRLRSTRRSSAADRRQGLRRVRRHWKQPFAELTVAIATNFLQFSSGGNRSSRMQEGVRLGNKRDLSQPGFRKLHITWAVRNAVPSTLPCESCESTPRVDVRSNISRHRHLGTTNLRCAGQKQVLRQ